MTDLTRQRSTAPVVTYALIALNVLMFLVQMMSRELTDQLKLWPPAVADGEMYRLVTSAFSHYGPAHLLFNMWALYVLGVPLERSLGRLRFIALYALSALGGAVAVYLFSPLNTATVGASGAVFGLFGAIFVLARRLNFDVRWIAALIAINLVLTFVSPDISWQGHLGGLVTGALLAVFCGYPNRGTRNYLQAAVAAAVLGVFGGLIWWRTAVLVAQFGSG